MNFIACCELTSQADDGRRVKSDLVLCYRTIFNIVHLNKHDFFICLLSLPEAINSKYTSVLTVALFDRISFVKGC